jgi:coenzyme Q-binding protein COQ10
MEAPRIVQRYLPGFTPERLFAIAADVESYPRFLFWCESARVARREGNRLTVDNQFGIGPLRTRFETKAVLDPPRSIDVTSSDGPFLRLRISWRFEAAREGGCRITLEIDQAFRSPLFDAAARPFLATVEEQVIRAFIKRAKELHPL